MEQQDWDGRQLDKDFLSEGNKVYSPSTCMFVPNKINSFILTCGKVRGEYPISVSADKRNKKNPYGVKCRTEGGDIMYLGMFPTPQKAHQVWLIKKLEVCEEYIVEFKEEPLLIRGLTRIKDKLEYHIETRTELVSF